MVRKLKIKETGGIGLSPKEQKPQLLDPLKATAEQIFIVDPATGSRKSLSQTNEQKQEPIPPIPEPPKLPDLPEIHRDPEGRVTGVTVRGKTFSTGNASDLLGIAKGNVPTPTPQGSVEFGEAEFQRNKEQFSQAQQQRALELFKRLREQPQDFSNIQPFDLNLLKALVPAGFGIGAAGAGAAGAGLVGASAATGGIVGAAAITAGIFQARSNIRQQITGNIQAQALGLSPLQKSLRHSINAVNSGDDPIDAVTVFYENVNQLRLREARAKKESTRFATTLTGQDATEELAKFETFFSTTLPLLERDLQLALLNPNPNNIKIVPEESESI